jgi:hypothetical protein
MDATELLSSPFGWIELEPGEGWVNTIAGAASAAPNIPKGFGSGFCKVVPEATGLLELNAVEPKAEGDGLKAGAAGGVGLGAAASAGGLNGVGALHVMLAVLKGGGFEKVGWGASGTSSFLRELVSLETSLEMSLSTAVVSSE